MRVKADANHRLTPEDALALKTRNASGGMVPLGTVLPVRATNGPDRVTRYNGYPAAEVNGAPSPGTSSGQALSAIAALAADELPPGLRHFAPSTIEPGHSQPEALQRGFQPSIALQCGVLARVADRAF